MLRVLIADDHELIRDGLKPFIEILEESVEISEAGSISETISIIEKGSSPDLILLDLRMPGMDGVNGVETVAKMSPSSKVVVVSGQFSRADILGAIAKGARGYIPKIMSGQAMVNALQLVLSGEVYLPAALLVEQETETGSDMFDMENPLSTLTARELEILGLLIEGNTNKQIARMIGVEEITVKIHLRNVYKKIAATNRADAVRIAMQNGWCS